MRKINMQKASTILRNKQVISESELVLNPEGSVHHIILMPEQIIPERMTV